MVVLDDWNMVVDDGREGEAVGTYGLGIRNERGRMLVNFCKKNSLVVRNKLFEIHKRKRYTWISRVDGQRYQTEYIMIRSRHKNCMKTAKAYSGADINSDYNLIMAEVQIRLRKVKGGRVREI